MSSVSAKAIEPKMRIASIDQLRGFAIFGMLLVDYFGCFDHTWSQLHHHREGMTFADIIAPLFLFVVGMGMRLSTLKRLEHDSLPNVRKAILKRYALLTLIAFTLYTGYLWDALMNIGLAGLLAVFLVDKKPSVRITAGLLFLAAYQAVFSLTVYGGWLLRVVKFEDDTMPLLVKLFPFGPELMDCPINGGPLGFWSWALMLLCGTIAYDIMASKNTRTITAGCLAWGVALCVIGYALKIEWTGVKAAWPFSKYYVTAPYALWSSGLCFLILLAFYGVCDLLRVQIPHLTVFGTNPLVIYILQWCIMESACRFIPDETTNWMGIWLGFAVFYGICYGTAYYLHQKKIFVKL